MNSWPIGSARAVRRSRTPCDLLGSAAGRSNICWPTASSALATLVRCSATPDRSLQESLARRGRRRGLECSGGRGGGQGRAEWSYRATMTPSVEPIVSPSPEHDGAGVAPTTRLRPPGLLELEELLADHLETRVSVQMGAKRGRISHRVRRSRGSRTDLSPHDGRTDIGGRTPNRIKSLSSPYIVGLVQSVECTTT